MSETKIVPVSSVDLDSLEVAVCGENTTETYALFYPGDERLVGGYDRESAERDAANLSWFPGGVVLVKVTVERL